VEGGKFANEPLFMSLAPSGAGRGIVDVESVDESNMVPVLYRVSVDG